MIKVEMIITDDFGHRIIVEQAYDQYLTGNNLDNIEQLVFRAKNELGEAAEAEILRLNQSEYTVLKKKRVMYLKEKESELFGH